jgi:hypothetical protein
MGFFMGSCINYFNRDSIFVFNLYGDILSPLKYDFPLFVYNIPFLYIIKGVSPCFSDLDHLPLSGKVPFVPFVPFAFLEGHSV